MIITVHSYNKPISVDTDTIKAFVWNIEKQRIELIINHEKCIKLTVDETLYELEQKWIMGNS